MRMDLPKDKQALPSLPAPERQAKAIRPSAGEVVAYLRNHPDFLITHPELLSILTPPKVERGDRVIDMQHFMVQRQRGEIAQLKHQQKSLIAVSRANLATQARVHSAVIAILAATTFEQLIQIVTTDLATLLDADVVTLAVERQGSHRARLPHHGVQILDAGVVNEVLSADRDVALLTDTVGEARLFGDGAGLVRSAALVRLPV